MAQPVIESALSSSVPRKIAIIDASVSMLSDAYGDGNTRFDRAISEVRTLAKSTVDAGGEITVIVAGEKASYTTVRATERTVADLNSMLDEMSGNASEYCSRGSADIVGAMSLAEEVLSLTPRAEVIYYSGKEYIDTGSVQVKNVSDANEYNIAILDGEAKLEENLYQFVVDIASYNRDEQFQLYCEIYGINGDSSLSAKYEKRIQPSGDEV